MNIHDDGVKVHIHARPRKLQVMKKHSRAIPSGTIEAFKRWPHLSTEIHKPIPSNKAA